MSYLIISFPNVTGGRKYSSLLHQPSYIMIYCREVVGGLFSGCSYKAVNPALYPSDISLTANLLTLPVQDVNKERFHNALALSLGYQRIVNNKRINISIDDKQYPDDVLISIVVDGFSRTICYRASEGLSQNDMDCLGERSSEDIKTIVDAVHQAYIQATRNPFEMSRDTI